MSLVDDVTNNPARRAEFLAAMKAGSAGSDADIEAAYATAQRALGQASRRALPSATAFSAYTGFMSAFNNSVAKTWHHFQAVEAPFIAVRPIFAHSTTTQSFDVGVCKITVSPDPATDPRMNNKTWVNVTKGGLTSWTVPAAPGLAADNRIQYSVTDWTYINSVPNAEGTFPIVACRAYIPTAVNGLIFPGGNTYSMAGWRVADSINRGRVWSSYYQDGDAATTTTAFTSTTQRNSSPIIGFEYMSADNVISYVALGDSIDWSVATGMNLVAKGYWADAAWDVSDAGPVKVQYANLGWPGTKMNSIQYRLADFLASGIGKPSFISAPIGSPNDMGTITDGNIAEQKRCDAIIRSLCNQFNIPRIARDVIPSNPDATPTPLYNWGATDSKRRDMNDAALARVAQGDLLLRANRALSGGINGNGQEVMAAGLYDTTNLHPIQAGSDVLKPLAKALIQEVIGLRPGKAA